jgi:hypothetical protein
MIKTKNYSGLKNLTDHYLLMLYYQGKSDRTQGRKSVDYRHRNLFTKRAYKLGWDGIELNYHLNDSTVLQYVKNSNYSLTVINQ